MNLTTKGKAYFFFTTLIVLCVLAMWIFEMNIYFKAFLCAMIVIFIAIMRSLNKAPVVTDRDDDKKLKSLTNPPDEDLTRFHVKNHIDAIDIYLGYLIEADEELASDSYADRSSSCYIEQLHERISQKIESDKYTTHLKF